MLWEQHDAYRAAAIAFRLKPEATLLERVASGFSRKDA
jgi:hypothetical protein